MIYSISSSKPPEKMGNLIMPIHTRGNHRQQDPLAGLKSHLASLRARICTQTVLPTTSFCPYPDRAFSFTLNTAAPFVSSVCLKASDTPTDSVLSDFFDRLVFVLQIQKIIQRENK